MSTRRIVLAALSIGLAGAVAAHGQTPSAPAASASPDTKPVINLILPGESFLVLGRPAFVMLPPAEKRSTPQPWIFYAPTLSGYPDQAEKWMHERFLAAGVAVAGVDVGEAYGSPASHAVFNALHQELTGKRGFAPKACLLGRSRGGLWVSSWAIADPGKVAGIAGIYPVYDLRAYPGLAKAAPAYGLKPEELEKRLHELNPIARVGELAKAKVPVFIIHGDVDKVVPLALNSGELLAKYKAAEAEGLVTLVVAQGQGHNFWEGFFRCQELVAFAIERAKAGAAATGDASPKAAAPAAGLPAPGLIVDLNADKGVEVQDGKVVSWTSQAAFKATIFKAYREAGKPALAALGKPGEGKPSDGPGGARRAIEFHHQELVNDDEDAFDTLTTGEGYTWLCVMAALPQKPQLKDVNSIFGNLRNGPQFEGFWANVNDDNSVWIGSRNGRSFGRFNADNPKVQGPVLEAGRPYVLAGRMGAGQGEVAVELFVNQAKPVASKPIAVNPKANPSKLAIGQEREAKDHPGKESFDGQIARLLIWNRPLSDAELASALTTLRQDYGVK